MKDSLSACYAAIYGALSQAGAVWGDRAYPDTSDGAHGRPYVVFAYAAGGPARWTRNPDANYMIDVICVAETLQDALTGAAQIEAALNNKGRVDGGTVIGDSEWEIQTITNEEKVHFTEPILSNTALLTHSGGRYRFIMRSLV